MAAGKTMELKVKATCARCPRARREETTWEELWVQRMLMKGRVWNKHRAETLPDVSSALRVSCPWVELPLIHLLHPPEALRS